MGRQECPFVPGWLNTDNVLIAYESLHPIKKKRELVKMDGTLDKIANGNTIEASRNNGTWDLVWNLQCPAN